MIDLSTWLLVLEWTAFLMMLTMLGTEFGGEKYNKESWNLESIEYKIICIDKYQLETKSVLLRIFLRGSST